MDASDPLTGVDRERTDILMYCTGGIRCDVYSAILRYQRLYNFTIVNLQSLIIPDPVLVGMLLDGDCPNSQGKFSSE